MFFGRHSAASAIVDKPGDDKVRRIKTSGQAFQKIAMFASLTALLETAGFVARVEDGDEVCTVPPERVAGC